MYDISQSLLYIDARRELKISVDNLAKAIAVSSYLMIHEFLDALKMATLL